MVKDTLPFGLVFLLLGPSIFFLLPSFVFCKKINNYSCFHLQKAPTLIALPVDCSKLGIFSALQGQRVVDYSPIVIPSYENFFIFWHCILVFGLKHRSSQTWYLNHQVCIILVVYIQNNTWIMSCNMQLP